jgi:hypothetical protein
VPFWQAFGAFSQKAGLKERTIGDLILLRPSYSSSSAGALIAVEQITLIDGKPEGGPTDSASAVRIRVVTSPDLPAPADDNPVALLFSLEPRLQWLSIDKTKVAKAVDDKEQDLALDSTDATPPNPKSMPPFIDVADGDFIGGGIYRRVVFHLKKGSKPGRSLKEFKGTITAKVLGETSAIISAPNILEAGGKTFKGGEDGVLKVVDVTKNENGRIAIRVEFDPPSGVVPPNGRGVPTGVAKKGEAAFPKGDMGPGFGWGTPNFNGLGLMDEKGNNIPVTPGGLLEVRGVQTPAGQINRMIETLVFQTEKGQVPSKMVFCGRKILSVEIPFALKDVPLP